MGLQSYKELVVWQKSIELVKAIYILTNQFPKSELYGLTSQMRRASVSIPSNIAEGSRRGTRKDFRNFLLTAYASGAELETQSEISKQLIFVTVEQCQLVDNLLNEVMRMLNSMIRKLAEKKTTHYSLLTTHS